MLKDRFGRNLNYLRLSLTDNCNLRCTYCMPHNPHFLPTDNLMAPEEINRLVLLLARLGVKKVRLTGGEPLIRKDFRRIWDLLSRTNLQLNLTTNGVFLRRYLPILSGRLHYLNVSLDSLNPGRYALISRSTPKTFNEVFGAIEEALSYDFSAVKINVVVIRGFNEDEIPEFVRLTEDWPVAVRFIEFMPFNGNGWSADRVVPVSEMMAMVTREFPLLPVSGLSNVSEDYRVPGFRGVVGFIGSMTRPFCDTCNRLRITADGHLKPCLFSPYEVDLLGPMRRGATDNELTDIIVRTVMEKPKGHPGVAELSRTAHENRRMSAIGG